MQFGFTVAKQALLLVTLFTSSVIAQDSNTAPFVRPIEGSRMVVGDGEVPDFVVDCFLHLCQKVSPKIAVINLDGSARISEARYKERGASSVVVVNSIPEDAEALTMTMLCAQGVWIEGDPEAVAKHPLLLALLKSITQRNGVIAFGSSAVSLASELDENDKERRLQSPFSKFDFHFGKEFSKRDNVAADSNSKVHWSIPDSAALVIHRGRWVAGYGATDIRMLVEKANGWPERRGTFECLDVFGPGGYPSYGADLLSWVRSANERSRPVFPPKDNPAPVVESGTLFLHGGSRIHKNVMEEFVKIVGGKDAPIVCIPSSQRFGPSEEPDSYSHETLTEMGCNNVTILHTDDPLVANQSEEFAELLKNAKGIWIDGGRTFRFMDCYEGTRVEELIAEVLERGGVVGGSSAGCQVPSDFLVRGNPRSNQDIAFGGYTRGMGLLKGVIIDAHFLQRGRHEPLLGLMKKHPQMLGIGIDESTAIVVKGHSAKVIGPNAVSFYDLATNSDEEFKPVILKEGETYDLKLRQSQK